MDKGLYNRLEGLQKHLGNFAMSLTLNKEDAEDLMQETNLKVLDNHDKYVDNTNFKGWVFTIMRNIFINNYRRAARSKTLIDTTDDLYHLNLPQNSGYDSPECFSTNLPTVGKNSTLWAIFINPTSTLQGMPSAALPQNQSASCASCPSFAFRATCAYG